jgi:hypothetical protein
MQNEIVTASKLKKLYGAHATCVLADFIESVPLQKKGERTKFTIIKDLPSNAEFAEMRKKRFTTTVIDLVCDGIQELRDLTDELQSWYDNLPQSFQDGDKGSQLQDAIGTLENINDIEVIDRFATLSLVFLPMEDFSSRARRRESAVAMLNAAIERLTEETDQNPATEDSEIDDLISEIEDAVSEAESVEFPGMY